MELKELKVRAYDILATIEHLQKELVKVNAEIVKAASASTEEKVAE